MTDQTIPDVTDDDRKLAREWAEHVESSRATWGDRFRAAARVILNAVPAPTTLADVTEEERAACQWMQADVETWGRAVIILADAGRGRAVTLNREGHMAYDDHDTVTPRPDLPRMEWPGDKKPAPALPDGWRLADHEKRGRVIVTNTTPNIEGRVYYVLPSADPLGFDWLFCAPDELTYLDQGADQ